MADEPSIIWQLQSYKHGSVSVVQHWYDNEADDDMRAWFEARFRYLVVAPPDNWKRPYSDTLRGKCKGFREVRLKARNIHHRLVGCTGPERHTFTVFVISEKKDFDSECKEAHKRKALYDSDRTRYSHVPDCFSQIIDEAQEQAIQRRLRRGAK